LELTTAILGVGLIVAGANFAWQVHTWRHTRRVDVTVEVEHDNQLEEPIVEVLDGRPRNYKLEYELTVVARNRGERTVFVEQFGIRQAADPATYEFHEPKERALPPDKSRKWSIRVEHLAFGLEEGFVAYVLLGSGKAVESAPNRLDSLLLEATA
jgi:hypothetical protein